MPDMEGQPAQEGEYAFREVGKLQLGLREVPLIERYPDQLKGITEEGIRAIEAQLNSAK